MSTEEDTELRDLVSQALEAKGVLPKIRAELRANVFLALEENNTTNESVLNNNAIHEFAQNRIGPIVLNLIREFLNYYDLGFTLSVFSPETKCGQDYDEISGPKLSKLLDLPDDSCPAICALVKQVLLKPNSVGNVCMNGDVASPLGLNSTYTKSTTNDTPVHLSDGDLSKENESIDEDLVSNKSSVPDICENGDSPIQHSDLGKSPLSPMNGTDADTTPPPERESLDMMTFTPLKDVTTREQSIVADSGEVSLKDSKEKEKSMLGDLPLLNGKEKSLLGDLPPLTSKEKSMLGDLPPLTAKPESFSMGKNRGSHIHEIKAIYAHGLDMDNFDEDSHSSGHSKGSKAQTDNSESGKSDQSHRSVKTETVDEELDQEQDVSQHSEQNHGQNSMDSQVTVDETISQAAGICDHLESM